MRFVRIASEELSEIDQDHQVSIEEKNQRHLNIQYLRRKNGVFFGSEMYRFNFTYDVTNPHVWYATLQPSSTSSTTKTHYYPVTTAQGSLSSKDAMLELATELAPMATLFGNFSLMAHLIENTFKPDGTTNLSKLKQLHHYSQQTLICSLEPSSPLYKHPLYLLFDMLATQANSPNSTSSDDKLLTLTYMQIIHATKDNPDLLQHAVNQDGAFVNNIFNLDKIKATLQIPSLQAGLVSVGLSSELSTILKEYADKRTHNTALAHHWYTAAKKQNDDDIASTIFFYHTWLVLTIINASLMIVTLVTLAATGLPHLLLPLAIFAGGALFFGYMAQQPIPIDPFSKLEISAAEQSFEENASLTQEQQSLSTDYMQQACRVFDAQLLAETTCLGGSPESDEPISRSRSESELPVSLGASRLSILASRSTSPACEDLTESEETRHGFEINGTT